MMIILDTNKCFYYHKCTGERKGKKTKIQVEQMFQKFKNIVDQTNLISKRLTRVIIDILRS